MKLSNFKLIEVLGTSALSWKFTATVTVTTTINAGFLWRKKVDTVKENVRIYKKYGCSWSFVETGEFTPGEQAETLQRKFESEVKNDIENYKPINDLVQTKQL